MVLSRDLLYPAISITTLNQQTTQAISIIISYCTAYTEIYSLGDYPPVFGLVPHYGCPAVYTGRVNIATPAGQSLVVLDLHVVPQKLDKSGKCPNEPHRGGGGS